MDNKVRLQKTVQEKDSYNKVISREFTTFVQPSQEEDPDTVVELFRMYDKLYLDIPLTGPRSHTYLIEQSSELVQITQDNSDIEPLLDEITTLRRQLLEANESIEELQNQLTNEL